MFRVAGVVLAVGAASVSVALAQTMNDVLLRHGVLVNGSIEAAFDAYAAPSTAVAPGALAVPLGVLSSTAGAEQIHAAYAFGILAGRSGRAASAEELAAAGRSLIAMIGSNDRRARVAGARVAGRIFAAPIDGSVARPAVPPGMPDALFALLNRDQEVDQLVAMDALGLMREASAVASLTERYHFYRQGRRRALTGGALEALARIAHPSSIDIVRVAASDAWLEGRDATALAVLFARQRLLNDGSMAAIRAAAGERSRGDQARGYLAELGSPVP